MLTTHGKPPAVRGESRPLLQGLSLRQRLNGQSVTRSDARAGESLRPVARTLEPMVLGEERILSRAHQLLLATWAAKTALMFDASTGTEAVIPMGYYREFAQLRAPLPSTQVWLGAYAGARPGLAWRHALWLDVPLEEIPNAFVTTFTAYRVVFQVAGHFVKDAAFRDRRYQFASGIHRIWPLEPGSIRLPRESSYSATTLWRPSREVLMDGQEPSPAARATEVWQG
jgi:hypothetical protein